MSARNRPRRAAQASQAAIAAHYDDEDGNAFLARFHTRGRAGGPGEADGEELVRVLTAAERRVRKRLEDLERTNHVDVPFKLFQDGLRAPPSPPAAASPASPPHKRRKTTTTTTTTAATAVVPPVKKQAASAKVRALLTAAHRRTLAEVLAAHPHPAYDHAASKPSRKPPRHICLPCGALGAYKCARCAEWTCSIGCREMHDESGCVRY